jgi:hypothetical protein
MLPPQPRNYLLTWAGILGIVAACICGFLGMLYIWTSAYSSIWRGWEPVGVLGVIAFACGLVGSAMTFRKNSYVLGMLGAVFTLFYGVVVIVAVTSVRARDVLVWFYLFPISIIALSFISVYLIYVRKNDFS